MTDLPAYLYALEAALLALPPDSEAMVLSQLDGFIAGVIVSPDPVPAEEWLPEVWGEDATEETAVVGAVISDARGAGVGVEPAVTRARLAPTTLGVKHVDAGDDGDVCMLHPPLAAFGTGEAGRLFG